jgi:hypothetical protein
MLVSLLGIDVSPGLRRKRQKRWGTSYADVPLNGRCSLGFGSYEFALSLRDSAGMSAHLFGLGLDLALFNETLSNELFAVVHGRFLEDGR